MIAPAEGAEGAPFSLIALAVSIVATLCLAWSLHRIARHGDRRSILLAAFGLCLACAATVYVHDMVNVPDAAAVFLVGSGIGILLARRRAFPPPDRLAPPLYLLSGAVALIVALSALANPQAFGVATPLPAGAAALFATILIAAAAFQPRRPAWLALPAGATAASLGLAFGNPPLVLIGALLAGAGAMLALRPLPPRT
jgi:NAD/NADP transhydrogenase beta subunit